MHILFCDYEYPPLGGGGGVVNAWLAEELAKQHSVTVLTSGAEGLPVEENVNGVRVIRVPVYFRKRLQTASFASMLVYVANGIFQGYKLVRQEQFDIISTFFVIPTGPVGHVLSRLAKAPNVLSVLGGDIYDPSKKSSPHRHALLRSIVRYLLKKADLVTGESHDVIKNVNKYYSPDLETTLVPLGIPRPPAVVVDRKDYDIGEEDFVLVTVGRLVARKAVDQLLNIVSRVENKNVKLFVLGDGPEQAALKSLANQLGIAQSTRFVGHVSDEEKLKILHCADIYVSTSQHEGFGLVFLEAMSAGLPVICYDHGGQTDFLADGETGYLVPLNEASLFQGCIEKLRADKTIREAMSAANLVAVESHFMDTCAQEYENLFEEVLSRKQ